MVEEKEKLCKEYLEATQSAVGAIESNQLEELLELLAVREELIEQIDRLDQAHGSIIMSPTIQQLLNSVVSFDQRLITNMNEKRDELRSKVTAIQAGKQLRNQYNRQNEYVDGIFYDQRK